MFDKSEKQYTKAFEGCESKLQRDGNQSGKMNASNLLFSGFLPIIANYQLVVYISYSKGVKMH